MNFRPMLASPANLSTLTFPIFASPKLDGIRATVIGGKLLSRTLKRIPNNRIFSDLSLSIFEGLDGELIVGDPTAHDAFLSSTSGVMSIEGEPDYTFYVFDHALHPHWHFSRRLKWAEQVLKEWPSHVRLKQHEHVLLHDMDQLNAYEAKCIAAGYEGLILRAPEGPYKHGRSTAREGWMLKVKRFEDSEAEVIGVEEEMFNGNEAQTNELGRTKRSTAKAGLVGKGTMGALVVRDLKTGTEFNIGSGFTAADRAAKWELGEIVRYKFFPVGVLLKPRHPVFTGRRSKIDL